MMLLSLNEQMSEDVTQRKIADMTRTLSTFFKLSTELFGSKIAIDLVKMIEVNLLGYPIFHIYMEPFPHRGTCCFNNLHAERLSNYHTTFHCFDLARRAYDLAVEQNILRLSKFDVAAIQLAAFYHDYAHSHGTLTDDKNVENAMTKFDTDVVANAELFREIDFAANTRTTLETRVRQLIQFSKYPYEKYGETPMLRVEACETFRLLDVLQYLECDMGVSLCGLYNEMVVNGKNEALIGMSRGEFAIKVADFVEAFPHVGATTPTTAQQLKSMAAMNIRTIAKQL
jgi:hypothetical protein